MRGQRARHEAAGDRNECGPLCYDNASVYQLRPQSHAVASRQWLTSFQLKRNRGDQTANNLSQNSYGGAQMRYEGMMKILEMA